MFLNMKTLTCIAVFLVAVSASLFEDAGVHFREFKAKHGKVYKNQAEETKRFAIFRDNLKSFDEHNALYEQGKTTWLKGITKFADWTDEEYKSMLSAQKISLRKVTGAKESHVPSDLKVPESIDWREKGQVTPVRDQGNCAASWAFSVAGAIEAVYYRKTGELVVLSEQQLLDCSSEVGNRGCSGGRIHETMPYVSWHGIQSEASYPYVAKDEECLYNASSVVTKIDNFHLFSDNQYELEQVVGNIGPVSGAIDADYLKDYKSGIYENDNCDYTTDNLAVLIVGYGSTSGVDYWIVKNCFGADWGEDGYFRILKKPNSWACGLYLENVYPIIN